jgi:hypothetical protein
VLQKVFICADLARMEVRVKQTFMWFVLLLAFVVKDPNLEVTVDSFICSPRHVITFYLRTYWNTKRSSWGSVVWSVTCGWSIEQLQLCTAPCAPPRAVWNKLLRRSPCFQVFIKNLMNRLTVNVQLILHQFQDQATVPEHQFPKFCNCPWISRSWRPPTPYIILKVPVPVSEKTRVWDRASFPWTVWRILLVPSHVFPHFK